jgi:hypothetical protein
MDSPSLGTRGQRGWKRLFSSEYTNRAYQQAQPLPFSNGTTLDVNPQIAPDGAFLVFCSADECRATRKIISLLFSEKPMDGGRWCRSVALAMIRPAITVAMTNCI